MLERSLALAQRAGLAEHVGRAYIVLVATRSGPAATASRSATCRRGSTTAATEVWSAIGSTCSPTARAWSSTRAAGRRQATPPRPSFASPAPRSRPASSRSWCSRSSGRGAETRAGGSRSRRRGQWRSRPGSCRDWRRRRPRPRDHGRYRGTVRAPADRRVGAGGRALARDRLPVRGRARACRRRRGGAAAARAGGAAAAGGVAGGGDRRPAPARARGAPATTRPAARHAAESRRPDAARAGGARATQTSPRGWCSPSAPSTTMSARSSASWASARAPR
jgi:hypothetical protein